MTPPPQKKTGFQPSAPGSANHCSWTITARSRTNLRGNERSCAPAVQKSSSSRPFFPLFSIRPLSLRLVSDPRSPRSDLVDNTSDASRITRNLPLGCRPHDSRTSYRRLRGYRRRCWQDIPRVWYFNRLEDLRSCQRQHCPRIIELKGHGGRREIT